MLAFPIIAGLLCRKASESHGARGQKESKQEVWFCSLLIRAVLCKSWFWGLLRHFAIKSHSLKYLNSVGNVYQHPGLSSPRGRLLSHASSYSLWPLSASLHCSLMSIGQVGSIFQSTLAYNLVTKVFSLEMEDVFWKKWDCRHILLTGWDRHPLSQLACYCPICRCLILHICHARAKVSPQIHELHSQSWALKRMSIIMPKTLGGSGSRRLILNSNQQKSFHWFQ